MSHAGGRIPRDNDPGSARRIVRAIEGKLIAEVEPRSLYIAKSPEQVPVYWVDEETILIWEKQKG